MSCRSWPRNPVVAVEVAAISANPNDKLTCTTIFDGRPIMTMTSYGKVVC
jgi:hypothetical protein